MRVFLLTAISLVMIAGCGGGNPAPTPTPTPSPTPTPVADRRALRLSLRANGDALLTTTVTIGSESATSTITYNLKDGTQVTGTGYVVALPSGASVRITRGVPVQNNDGSKPFRSGAFEVLVKKTSASDEERLEVNLVRKNSVLGDEDSLTLTDRSADCNAATAPARFTDLKTWYDVPDAKNGFFSAYAQPTPTDTRRRFSFLIRDLTRGQLTGAVRVGDRVTFPASPSNPIQVNYNEEQPDGTVRQWTAVSGDVVFDAVDSTLPVANPLVGETYQTTGKVSFHFENLRFVASNSTSDPTFTGAQGSFTLGYAGTSTVGYKRYSRNW